METEDQMPLLNRIVDLLSDSFLRLCNLSSRMVRFQSEFQSLSDRVRSLEEELHALRGANRIGIKDIRPQGPLQPDFQVYGDYCTDCLQRVCQTHTH